MVIELAVETEFRRRVRRRDILNTALTTLRAEKVPPGKTMTIVIGRDQTVRELNRRFHKVDAPTDVLSFSYGDVDYLGDLVISYDTAKRNARDFRWPVRDELRLLVTHGVLHLLGYDDTSPRGRNRMWRRQAEILKVRINGAPSDKRRARTRSKPK